MYEAKPTAKDPICGMTVDQANAIHAERDGRIFYFCSDHCRKKFLSGPPGGKLEEKSGAAVGSSVERSHSGRKHRYGQDDLHVPDAPGSATGRSGCLLQVRHGAGAGNRHRGRGRRRERRTARHDEALLDRCRADDSSVHPGDGASDPRLRPAIMGGWSGFALDPIRTLDTRGLLGRLAVLPAWLALRRDAALEHVHADRHRRGRGLPLQRRGDARARPVPARDATRRQASHLFRGRRCHRRTGAPRPGARTPCP